MAYYDYSAAAPYAGAGYGYAAPAAAPAPMAPYSVPPMYAVAGGADEQRLVQALTSLNHLNVQD